MAERSGEGGGGYLFTAFDDQQQTYALIGIEYPRQTNNIADFACFAPIVDIIIESDSTYEPLDQILILNGILREQIILAYQGEALPEPQAG